MKKLIHSIIILLTLLFVYSCSNEDTLGETPSSEKKAIKFTTSAKALKSSGYSPVQIATGQKIGVFIEENASKPTVSYDQNISYTADGKGGLFGPVLYYPDNGNGIKMSAYHPFNDSQTLRYVFAVKFKQRTIANIFESDLMFADKITREPSDNPIALIFKHKLSRITYSLTAGSADLDLSEALVSIVNLNTAIEFDSQTGEIGESSQIGEIEIGADNGGIIVPQKVAKGTKMLKITFPSSGKEFYYESEGLTIESEKSYHFDLTVYSEDAIMGETTVDDWEETEIIEGSTGGSKDKKLLPIEITTSSSYENVWETGQLNFTYDNDIIAKCVLTTKNYHPSNIESYANHVEELNFIYNSEGFISSWTENYKAYNTQGELYTEKNYTGNFTYSKANKTYTFKYVGESANNWTFYTDDTWSLESLSRIISSQFDANNNLIFLDTENNEVTKSYEYDSKNNPFKNVKIKGCNFNFFDFGGNRSNLNQIIFGTNNMTKFTREAKNGYSSDVIDYIIEYNQYNYPVVIKSESMIDGIKWVDTTIIKYKEAE